jgi:SAM-dependent methyltransferase
MKPAPANTRLLGDATGAATLERMAEAPAYNRWTYDRISRWIGPRVLEVGAGIGNLSQFFVDRQRVVLTDAESDYRETLVRRFGEQRQGERRRLEHRVGEDRRSGGDRRALNVQVVEMSLPNVPDELAGELFSTIVCLNVLEHVQDDLASLRTMRQLLEPNGRLVLLVPALPALFCSLDSELGHFRRYTPEALAAVYAESGLRICHMEYFNLAGIFGWWWSGRVRHRKMIPRWPLKVFDMLVPLFRLERLVPWRVGLSLIAVGEPSE